MKSIAVVSLLASSILIGCGTGSSGGHSGSGGAGGLAGGGGAGGGAIVGVGGGGAGGAGGQGGLGQGGATDACAANVNQSSWDVAADFSITSNPCGVWTYGYATSLGSGLLTVYPRLPNSQTGAPCTTEVVGCDWHDPNNSVAGAPDAFYNNGFGLVNGVANGQFTLHPGTHGEYSTARWTAPRSGTFTFNIQFLVGDTGETDGAVLHGTTVLFEHATSTNPTFTTTVSMLPGDWIDAAVGITGSEDGLAGQTPTMMTVTSQ